MLSMATKSETSFFLASEWRITQSGNALLITGGADARYELALESDKPSVFAGIKSDVTIFRSELNPQDLAALEQLVTAEVIVPKTRKTKRLKVAFMGDSHKLPLSDSTFFSLTKPTQPYDIAVILRTNSTFAQLLDTIAYQSITRPHLFVETAFHHTLSIGPLVFPGETACIACLQGRISTRWGDDKPPRSPQAIAKYTELITVLINTELQRIAKGDSSLVNKTYAWDLQDREISHNRLLKVPLCPICINNKIDHSGALALPW